MGEAPLNTLSRRASTLVPAFVLRMDDLPIAGQRTVEAHAHCGGLLYGDPIDRLDVKVRFGAVARVPTARNEITGDHMLPGVNHDAGPLQMTQRDDGIAAVDKDMVARQRLRACGCPATLGQRVVDRGRPRYAE